MRALVPAVSVLALGLLTMAPAGCGGGPATATERLWISGLPTTPKTPITAFATTRTGEATYLGAFFKGTALRGGHDVFEWKDEGNARATIKFMQDGTTAKIHFEPCKPSVGFDHCLLVHDDPTGTKRYQSRKRWVVKRPGKRKDLGGAFVLDVLAELSEEDAALAAAFGEEE